MVVRPLPRRLHHRAATEHRRLPRPDRDRFGRTGVVERAAVGHDHRHDVGRRHLHAVGVPVWRSAHVALPRRGHGVPVPVDVVALGRPVQVGGRLPARQRLADRPERGDGGGGPLAIGRHGPHRLRRREELVVARLALPERVQVGVLVVAGVDQVGASHDGQQVLVAAGEGDERRRQRGDDVQVAGPHRADRADLLGSRRLEHRQEPRVARPDALLEHEVGLVDAVLRVRLGVVVDLDHERRPVERSRIAGRQPGEREHRPRRGSGRRRRHRRARG